MHMRPISGWVWLVLSACLIPAGVGVAAETPAAPATRPAATRGAAAATGATILQERPDRLIVELPNRLLVVVQEVHTAPVVSAQTWVKTGSIYEQEHVGAGLSHFLEHLLSGGATSTRTEEEANALLGRIGANVNASTGLDTVDYYVNTTSDHAATAIELLSDWMQHSLISETEYRRERDVIQREFEMGEGDPSRVFWKLTQQARYRQHPARHPTIGYLDEYLTISRDEIYDFYKRMYVPNNIVFVVVGDIDKAKTVEQIASLWADAKPGELPKLSLPVEPELTQPRKASGLASVEQPRLRLAWPGTRLGAEGDYALDLLAVVLGQGESSRLTHAVRDEARAAYGVNAHNLSFAWGEGYFGIDAVVAVPRPAPAAAGAATGPAATLPASRPAAAAGGDDASARVASAVERTRAVILAEVRRVQKEGITPDELARAKRQTLAHVIYEAQTAEDLAERLARDVIGTGDPDYLRRYADAIQRITGDEVAAAARKFLADSRMIEVTLLPQPKGHQPQRLTRPADEPNAGGAAGSVGSVAGATEPVRLDNAALVERLKAALAEKGPDTATLRVEPVQRFELSNGLRLLVQRSTVVPAVAMQVYQMGGLLADEPGREGLTNAAATMLLRGTQTRTAEQIAREVEDLGADLATEAGNNTSFTRAVSLKADWPAVLGLLADVTLQPSFPADEWDKLRPRLVAAIARQNDDWGGELRNRFRREYFGDGHTWSRSSLGRAEVVEALTPKDLAEHYRRRLGASQAVLAVFGDVDPEEVRRRAESLFAAMPAKPAEPTTPASPGPPRPRLVEAITAKPLAAAQVGFGPGVTRTSPDYAELQVLSRVLSSFPTGWLDRELRGRGPGLVYAVGGGLYTGVVPGYYALLFNANPDVLPEALRRSMAVVGRARDELIDATDLARAKAAVLTDEFFGKQSNADRAADAALGELYGLGPDAAEAFLKDVQAMTAEQVRDAARKYLVNPVAVVLTHKEYPQAELEAALRGGPEAEPTK